MYFTYVLENKNKITYTGSTVDLDDRISLHNDTSSKKVYLAAPESNIFIILN